MERLNAQKQKARQEEFERLLDLFHSQLRLRAPVKLWEKRASDHAANSTSAFKWFVVLATAAVISAALVPYCFGDYIAGSFSQVVCSETDPNDCVTQFSAKGPLTIAGLLMILSIVLWAVRLQYKVYLSERHLALDASEKQAFAETYLAMKHGEDVDKSNEAIVLASLFRPTQDGIIKDDESGFDFSAAAIIAKQLGK